MKELTREKINDETVSLQKCRHNCDALTDLQLPEIK